MFEAISESFTPIMAPTFCPTRRRAEEGEHLYTRCVRAVAGSESESGPRVCRPLGELFWSGLILGLGDLKRKDGEPVFSEPWHAQALAMADLLVKAGKFSRPLLAKSFGRRNKRFKGRREA